jgi:hypothetical protein
MVSMFVESGLGGKRRDTETARRFIDEQIKSYDVKLRQAENRLKEFKLRNFGYTGEPGTDYFARVGTLNGELSRLRVELRASRTVARRAAAGTRRGRAGAVARSDRRRSGAGRSRTGCAHRVAAQGAG